MLSALSKVFFNQGETVMKNKNILFVLSLIFSGAIHSVSAAPVTAGFTVTASVPYTYNMACGGLDTCTNDAITFPSLTQDTLSQGVQSVASATIYTDDVANGVSFSLVPQGSSTFEMSAPGISTTIPYAVSYTGCTDVTAPVTPNTYQPLSAAVASIVAINGTTPCANYKSTANPNTQEAGRGDFTFTIAPYTSNFPTPSDAYTQSVTVDVCDGDVTSC